MFEQEIFTDSADDPFFHEMNAHQELTRRTRAGDERAFTELVRQFHTPLCTYLARLVGNDELGRDLAQETLMRAWTSLPSLREEQHFKAWLYRIATNLAHSHLRRARLIHWLPWKEVAHGPAYGSLSIAGPEEHIGESELVRKTLARLSPQYRTCLLLQTVAGFSQRDIAQLLGISEKSVGSNVCRARDQFRHIYTSLKGDIE